MEVMEFIFNVTYDLGILQILGKRFSCVNFFIFTFHAQNNVSGCFTIFQMYILVDGHKLDEGSH